MEVLARIRAGSREIECGLATIRRERAAVLAQRFRVYQRKGYYRPGLRVDRDPWDRKALYFLALLRDEDRGGVLLGSARLIVGESGPRFRFPTEDNFELEMPAAIRATAVCERAEVSRVVAEGTRGIVIGGLLTPLGLLQAMAEYARPRGIRCGLAGIKQRLLRALQVAGVSLHEIEAAKLVSPGDGPLSGYFYGHPDPVIPTYWLTDEIAPSIEQAISVCRTGHSTLSAARDLPASSSPTTQPGSKRNDTEGRLATDPAARCVTRLLPTSLGSGQTDPLPSNGPVDDP